MDNQLGAFAHDDLPTKATYWLPLATDRDDPHPARSAPPRTPSRAGRAKPRACRRCSVDNRRPSLLRGTASPVSRGPRLDAGSRIGVMQPAGDFRARAPRRRRSYGAPGQEGPWTKQSRAVRTGTPRWRKPYMLSGAKRACAATSSGEGYTAVRTPAQLSDGLSAARDAPRVS